MKDKIIRLLGGFTAQEVQDITIEVVQEMQPKVAVVRGFRTHLNE